jgi:TIR domain
VETGDIWNEWVEPFDLFISYTREDNATGMVSALVETIEADFAQFSPSVPLKVYFDKKSILDMQYWQDVLKKGLRQSKVMLAVLSEAYFNSEWRRREWDRHRRQACQSLGGSRSSGGVCCRVGKAQCGEKTAQSERSVRAEGSPKATRRMGGLSRSRSRQWWTREGECDAVRNCACRSICKRPIRRLVNGDA